MTLAFAMSLSTAGAQQGTVTYYGAPCFFPTTPFQVIGEPKIGATFFVETNASYRYRTTETYWVLAGISDRRIGSTPLPIDLTLWSSAGTLFCGTLLQSSEVILPGPIGPSGTPVQVPFPVPFSQVLVGSTIYLQVLGHVQPDQPRNIYYYSTSQAARLVIGR